MIPFAAMSRCGFKHALQQPATRVFDGIAADLGLAAILYRTARNVVTSFTFIGGRVWRENPQDNLSAPADSRF